MKHFSSKAARAALSLLIALIALAAFTACGAADSGTGARGTDASAGLDSAEVPNPTPIPTPEPTPKPTSAPTPEPTPEPTEQSYGLGDAGAAYLELLSQYDIADIEQVSIYDYCGGDIPELFYVASEVRNKGKSWEKTEQKLYGWTFDGQARNILTYTLEEGVGIYKVFLTDNGRMWVYRSGGVHAVNTGEVVNFTFYQPFFYNERAGVIDAISKWAPEAIQVISKGTQIFDGYGVSEDDWDPKTERVAELEASVKETLLFVMPWEMRRSDTTHFEYPPKALEILSTWKNN